MYENLKLESNVSYLIHLTGTLTSMLELIEITLRIAKENFTSKLNGA